MNISGIISRVFQNTDVANNHSEPFWIIQLKLQIHKITWNIFG